MSTPFAIVGDEVFPLNKHVMKPYAKVELDDLKKKLITYYQGFAVAVRTRSE